MEGDITKMQVFPKYQRKPDWLKIRLPNTEEYSYMKSYLSKYDLHTICESGNCPNQAECWASRTATLMILGNVCSRSCKFCKVSKGEPSELDREEPAHVAEVVRLLGLKHCVITSVTRDDLADGGASIWAETINKIRDINPLTTIEALIPDMQGNAEHLNNVFAAQPDILSHNIETVKRLTPVIRVQASYDVSLRVLKQSSSYGLHTKSGIMLGLGELKEDVLEAMDDLLMNGCKVLTIGQYLQPDKHSFPLVEYVHPDVFAAYKLIAEEKGFETVESGPLVRSSYNSTKHLKKHAL